jgi:hypothetical protein
LDGYLPPFGAATTRLNNITLTLLRTKLLRHAHHNSLIIEDIFTVFIICQILVNKKIETKQITVHST